MPKICVFPECQSLEGKNETYYKFPLNDKVRLRQWLINMSKESFVPSINQHLCSRHFKPSCFQYKWGARLLKLDAVPTIFHTSGNISTKKDIKTKKPPSADHVVQKEIFIAAVPNPTVQMQSVPGKTVAIALDPNCSASHMFINGGETLVKEINTLAIPSQVVGAVNLVPLVHFVESFDGLSLAFTASQTQNLSPITLPIDVSVGQQMHHQTTVAESIALLSEEHVASASLQHALDTRGLVSEDHRALVIENIPIDPFSETGLPPVMPAEMSPEELFTYLETMQTATVVPSLQTGPLPPIMVSPETYLSPAITRPIPSTVPIVSKHSKLSENISKEQHQGSVHKQSQLGESLSTGQLVSVMADLQKKTLQQRHGRVCSKLEEMEGVAEQMKKENLISEGKLNLVDLAYLQPGSQLPESSNTVTIVCQEDNQAFMYTLPLPKEDEN
ncbi:THAP domain-containing protein 5 [Bombina bombina]|uniref:THAP domain-containing protein 5 n=1 Tax=Bombina bombina TaxID=8345 RepID=UPI00235AD409|nr:THAP domain-containing protein 5 [Bombina bombina]